uniref:14-3-3 domain-containing protein n=1 Tax=Ditylenchus dipsaci TaxID=166011 RepID=A0A915D307_9BILA
MFCHENGCVSIRLTNSLSLSPWITLNTANDFEGFAVQSTDADQLDGSSSSDCEKSSEEDQEWPLSKKLAGVFDSCADDHRLSIVKVMFDVESAEIVVKGRAGQILVMSRFWHQSKVEEREANYHPVPDSGTAERTAPELGFDIPKSSALKMSNITDRPKIAVSSEHHHTWDKWWKAWEEKRLAKNLVDETKFIKTARICEEAKRYEDMAHAMRKVVKLCTAQNKDLTKEQQMLLVSAYKNLIEPHMFSWRKLCEQRDNLIASKDNTNDTRDYYGETEEVIKEMQKVSYEIREICESIIRLQNNFLIPQTTDESSLDFYKNIKKEYYAYLEEIGAPTDIDDVSFYSV